jgi:hypothetical protein
LLAAGVVAWFINHNCFPVITTAVQKLPATGEIRSGLLNWPGHSPELLAQGHFLALDVDLDHSDQIGPASDVRIEFGRKTVRIFSLLGYLDWNYPPGYVFAFNRTGVEPLWGAWAMELLLMAMAVVTVCLLLCWSLLATIYFLPLWLLGFFANRDLNFRQSWRLAGAGLIPGALLMTAAILFYNFGFLNLVSFGFVFVAHFVMGWIYLFVSLLFLPALPAQKRNPFGTKSKKSPDPFGQRRRDNPFGSPHKERK